MEQAMFAQPWLSTNWYFPEEMGWGGQWGAPRRCRLPGSGLDEAAPKNDDKESRHHHDSANSKRKL